MHAVRDHYTDPIFDCMVRREVIIDNRGNSNELKDYQIDLAIDEKQLFFEAQDGLRFADENLQIINHWGETFPTKEWLEVPNVSASATCALYMFDGSPSVTSAGNGTNAFEFFDDFAAVNPTLRKGAATEWDDHRVVGGWIGLLDSTYYMYYGGEGGDGIFKIGLATSPDLSNWTKDSGNPKIVQSQSWEGTWVQGLTLLTDLEGNIVQYDNKYWGIYFGSNENIGLASATTITGSWTKDAGNPLISKGSGWEANGIRSFSFVKVDTTYYIFYQGYDATYWKIGYATCSTPDGTYTKYGSNPILVPDVAWEEHFVQDPIIRKYGGTYYLFYTGADASTLQRNAYATASSIGGAYTKYGSNPIMPAGISFPMVIEKDSLYYLTGDNHNLYEKDLWVSSDLASWAYSGLEKWDREYWPIISDSIITLNNTNGETAETSSTYLYKSARFRANFDTAANYQYMGFIIGDTGAYALWRTDDSNHHALSSDGAESEKTVVSGFTGGYHLYDILWKSDEVKFFIDGVLKATHTTEVPGGALDLKIYCSNPSLKVDWFFVRKYSTPEPTAEIGMMI